MFTLLRPTLAALATGTGAAFCVTAFAANCDVRLPEEFAKIIAPDAELKPLATGLKFCEGPVWVPADGGFLVFSDIPANELKRWDARVGLASYRQPSFSANGNTLDCAGRLISCEHGGRRVSVLQPEGQLQTLVDAFKGRKFNSPNDAVAQTNGVIWFTDPDYGLGGRPRELTTHGVYRFDPKSRTAALVATNFDQPNGISLAPDGRRLYVADSGKPRHIRAFTLQPDGRLADDRVFCVIDQGVPDGIRCDAEGRLWSSAGDGIQVFTPEGKLIAKLLVPEPPANLCFGGADGHTLFITARTTLYAVPVKVRGTGCGN